MKSLLLVFGGALMGAFATALFSSTRQDDESEHAEEVKKPEIPNFVINEGSPKPNEDASVKINFAELLPHIIPTLMEKFGDSPVLRNILAGFMGDLMGAGANQPQMGVATDSTAYTVHVPNNLDAAFNEYLGEYYQRRIAEGVADREVQEEMAKLIQLHPIEKLGLLSATDVINQFEEQETTQDNGEAQNTTA